jgi:hypothetical protein
MDNTTEDLPIGGDGAQEKIATQHARIAAASEAHAQAVAAIGGITPRERFVNILVGCLSGRVFAGDQPTVVAFLRAADELFDGVNERFPEPTEPPPPPPGQ